MTYCEGAILSLTRPLTRSLCVSSICNRWLNSAGSVCLHTKHRPNIPLLEMLTMRYFLNKKWEYLSDASGKNNGTGACTELVVKKMFHWTSSSVFKSPSMKTEVIEVSVGFRWWKTVGIVYSNRALITRWTARLILLSNENILQRVSRNFWRTISNLVASPAEHLYFFANLGTSE